MKSIIYFSIAIVFALTSSLPVLAVDTFSCTSVTEIPQVECEALVALYNSTNGSGWSNNTNWLVTTTPANWHAVTVGSGHVKKLDLTLNHLSGSLPPELGDLVFLAELNLYFNELIGNIPPELGNLTVLRDLLLENNHLSGNIPPELGNLGILNRLHLNNNTLSGSIPSELGNLGALTELYLYDNQLIGSIPPELGNLTMLTVFNLEFNQLSSSIPPELGNLTALNRLYLSHNKLSGNIPSELGNLTHLIKLELFLNQLNGSIPPELGNLTSLQVLDLDRNQLNGSIPSELGNLTQITNLRLSDNHLTGSIPPELGSLTNITNLNLSDNQLTGSIPDALGNLINLKIMRLNDNNLEGDVPGTFINLTNLFNPGMVWDGDGLNLDYNMLNVPPGYPDPGDPLQVFLHQKDPDWQLYQGFKQIISTGGGEFTSLDGRTDILIPAGALITDTTFTYIPQPAPQHGSARLVFANNSFELTAEDSIGSPVITFNLPLTITLTYTDTDIFGFPENTLGLYYWNDLTSTWTDSVTTCPGGAYTRNLDGNILVLPSMSPDGVWSVWCTPI